MPEGPEIRIMSDFINTKTECKRFTNGYHVMKGNKPKYLDIHELPFDSFNLKSDYYGKKLILNIYNDDTTIPIYIFMGMSGSWKWVNTDNWSDTKFTRLKFDCEDGNSLLLHGGYLGPKYSFFKNFKTSKDGYDIIKEYDKFVITVNESLNSNIFTKPIYEVLLDQRYFAGVGNYLRSTILYYADINPFQSAHDAIRNNPTLLSLCRDIIEESYNKNGGQLKDWKNPFEKQSEDFENWVYYNKGNKIKDTQGRYFWYNPKWK